MHTISSSHRKAILRILFSNFPSQEQKLISCHRHHDFSIRELILKHAQKHVVLSIVVAWKNLSSITSLGKGIYSN